MADSAWIVVGDKFEGFGATPGVMSVSVLLDKLEAGDLPGSGFIVEGQGLHDEQRCAIQTRLAERGIAFLAASCPRADDVLTHKRVPANVLVSVPERATENVYTADLLIDDRNEILSDHVTGRHVQGLILIEAARQVWTAVTERFYLGGEGGSFVIDEVTSRFERFLFPLPAQIRYTVTASSLGVVESSFHGTCELEQVGARTATISTRFRVMRPTVIAKHEMLAARLAVAALAKRRRGATAAGSEGKTLGETR